MADLGITPGDITGPLALVAFGAKLWWDDREKKRAALEAKAEAVTHRDEVKTETKLDQLLALTQRMERDLAALTKDLSHHAGALGEVKTNLDAIRGNYGGRISDLEKAVIEIRATKRVRR